MLMKSKFLHKLIEMIPPQTETQQGPRNPTRLLILNGYSY